jgi:hypothetical protein
VIESDLHWDGHLEKGGGCRAAVEQERVLKKNLRAAANRLRALIQLRNRILSDPRVFTEKSRFARSAQPTQPGFRSRKEDELLYLFA